MHQHLCFSLCSRVQLMPKNVDVDIDMIPLALNYTIMHHAILMLFYVPRVQLMPKNVDVDIDMIPLALRSQVGPDGSLSSGVCVCV